MSKVTEDARQAFSHHVVIDHQHRFIFFTIPKVACTEWKRLFAGLAGLPDWRDPPHHRYGIPLLSAVEAAEAEDHLNDPAWTKAVFFRDPTVRLLSAYLDKIVNSDHIPLTTFGSRDGEISFEVFIDCVTDSNTDVSKYVGLHPGTDPHWKPQGMTANIEKFLPCINYVGDFSNLYDDAKRLSNSLGIWDGYCSSGWGVSSREPMFFRNASHHFTGADDRLEEFYSADLFEEVRIAYRKDYELLDELGIHYIQSING
ncbi:MAG: sulfotransferase family protein [bacterium]|nr:sulfotransferase family protein [bacterium]